VVLKGGPKEGRGKTLLGRGSVVVVLCKS
jgi:hypothetical protein